MSATEATTITPTTTTKSTSTTNDIADAYGTGNNGYMSSSVSNRNVAKMTTDRYASEYNMRHKYRGRALIFNHEHFEIPSLKSRAGTNVDCENLAQTLKQLYFDVDIYKDCSLREMMRVLDDVSREDHTHRDCIMIAILSHGELGYIYAKDVQYKLDSVWNYFTAQNCPTLAGKPKLFFIQACQGDRLDGGVTLNKTETDGESSMSYKIPVHADFLIAYSTIPGFYSWRNTTKGSWFMQSLCKELNENGKRFDLLTLLTFVNQRVAIDFESNTPDCPQMHQQKQIPCITSMLTRILKFSEK